MNNIKFIGYQNGYGKIAPFALFDVFIKGHPYNKSTLSILTLEKIGLEVPPHPTYNQWVEIKDKHLAWLGMEGIDMQNSKERRHYEIVRLPNNSFVWMWR